MRVRGRMRVFPFLFFFLVQMRVRETSGTEGEAKKEIRDIYTHNINKYIFLYLLSRGKSTPR